MPLQARIDAANADIRAALRSGNFDLARVLISRKAGWMVLNGDIVVKLKKPTKATMYG